jgi:thiol-disulfide isomerase/thioredoxin
MIASIVAFGAACTLVVYAALQGWVLVQVRGQQRRMHIRLEDQARRLAARSANAAVRERSELLDRLAGQPARPFEAPALGGGRVSLDALLALAKPLLLIFTDPRCGPCYELLPDIAGWRRVYGDRLTIALVSTGDPRFNLAMTAEYGIRPVLLQQDRDIAERYGLVQEPAGLLINPDGRIGAGPRYGAQAIRQLMAETLGLALPPPPVRSTRKIAIGEALPPMHRPDLDGHPVAFGGERDESTLLLFWSPGCGPCRELLPELLAFDRAAARPRLVVVGRGPIGLNREAGFVSPVVMDDDRSVARALGVTGTPAAVLLDERGLVASRAARGAEGVRALLAATSSLAGTGADRTAFLNHAG